MNKYKMNQFYTYFYFDPKTNLPIYVGKGKGNRAFIHLTSSPNKRLHNTIKKRQSEGYILSPIITYKPDEETALAIEKFWIMYYGRADLGTGPLFNLTDGGDGPAGAIRTIEQKQHLSTVLSGKPTGRKGIPSGRKGEKFSEVHKQRIAEAKRGKKYSIELCEKLSAAHKGFKPSAESCAKMSAAHKGFKPSAESCARISAAKKGKPLTEAHKAALRVPKKKNKEIINE